MNKPLLKSLADYLEAENIPEEQFDMNHWGIENGVFCGCAIGWGMKGGILKDVYIDGNLFYKNRECMDWDVPSEIFNIRLEDAEYLFGSERYYSYDITKEEVVNRIREFING